jgi:transposase
VQNFNALPTDLAAAHAMILAERAACLEAEAQISGARLEIERLKLLLAPRGALDPRRFADGSPLAMARRDATRREQFGQTSERGKRLIDRLELQLAEIEEVAAEDESAAEAATGTVVAAHLRQKPARGPLPAHLPPRRGRRRPSGAAARRPWRSAKPATRSCCPTPDRADWPSLARAAGHQP